MPTSFISFFSPSIQKVFPLSLPRHLQSAHEVGISIPNLWVDLLTLEFMEDMILSRFFRLLTRIRIGYQIHWNSYLFCKQLQSIWEFTCTMHWYNKNISFVRDKYLHTSKPLSNLCLPLTSFLRYKETVCIK